MLSTGYATIWAAITVPILGGAAGILAALQAYVGPIFRLAVVAYMIVTIVVAAWSPGSEETVTRTFRQIAFAAILWALISNAATFAYYVSGAITGATNGVSAAVGNAFGAGGGPVAAATFDHIADKSYALGLVVLKQVPWYSLKSVPLGICVVVYWALTNFAIGMMFVIFLIASVATIFVVSFGPIFIALAFFPYTRRFFDGWVSAVVGAVLTQIFVTTLLTLFIVSQSNLLGQLSANVDGEADPGMFVAGLRNLFIAAAMSAIFVVLIGYSLKLATTIAGEVGIMMPRLPINSAVRAIGGLATGRPGGGAAAAAGGGGAGGGGAPRSFAFNRTVGSAP